MKKMQLELKRKVYLSKFLVVIAHNVKVCFSWCKIGISNCFLKLGLDVRTTIKVVYKYFHIIN